MSLHSPPNRPNGMMRMKQITSLLQQQQTEKAMMVANSIRDQALRSYALALVSQSADEKQKTV